MKKIAKAYGLWFAGVLSAAAAAWLLYRSRLITHEPPSDGWETPADHPIA